MMTKNNQRSWYRIKAQAENGRAEIYIYDVIVNYAWDEDEITAKGFIDDLKALGSETPLDLHINSPGGSVFAGLAIYNALKRHQAEVAVYIDGLAASIASVVAMAGDRIIMPENALLMIHDPYAGASGTAADLRKAAEMLDKATISIISAYRTQSDLKDEEIAALMQAETWFNAAEAVELGFADEIEESLPMAALADCLEAFDLSRYGNVPKIPEAAGNKDNKSVAAGSDGTSTKGERAMTPDEVQTKHQETYDKIFAAGKEAGAAESREAGFKEGLEEGRKAGAQAEAERIKAVEAQLIPGHEALIAELKADGKTTGEEAAVKVLAAEKTLRTRQAANLQNDSLPPVPPSQDEPDEKQEQQAVVKAMAAAGNRRR